MYDAFGAGGGATAGLCRDHSSTKLLYLTRATVRTIVGSAEVQPAAVSPTRFGGSGRLAQSGGLLVGIPARASADQRRPVTSARQMAASPSFGSRPAMKTVASVEVGERVLHTSFGMGTVIATHGSGDAAKADVDFGSVGIKRLSSYATRADGEAVSRSRLRSSRCPGGCDGLAGGVAAEEAAVSSGGRRPGEARASVVLGGALTSGFQPMYSIGLDCTPSFLIREVQVAGGGKPSAADVPDDFALVDLLADADDVLVHVQVAGLHVDAVDVAVVDQTLLPEPRCSPSRPSPPRGTARPRSAGCRRRRCRRVVHPPDVQDRVQARTEDGADLALGRPHELAEGAQALILVVDQSGALPKRLKALGGCGVGRGVADLGDLGVDGLVRNCARSAALCACRRRSR